MDKVERQTAARELHDKLIAYWHDVDFNWGRNAGAYYTEDGIFDGATFSYNGRQQIEEFYAFRRDRGPRVVLHAVINFHCTFESDTLAHGDWVCVLWAHDGEPPQESAPPISTSLIKDTYVLQDGEWLVKRRTWHTLFKGGVEVTILKPEDMAKRMESAQS